MDIQVHLKDDTVDHFTRKGRAGGSWDNSIKYEGAFAVIIDEWGNQTAYPAADVKKITTSGR